MELVLDIEVDLLGVRVREGKLLIVLETEGERVGLPEVEGGTPIVPRKL